MGGPSGCTRGDSSRPGPRNGCNVCQAKTASERPRGRLQLAPRPRSGPRFAPARGTPRAWIAAFGVSSPAHPLYGTVDRTQVIFSVDADSIVRDEAVGWDVIETQTRPALAGSRQPALRADGTHTGRSSSACRRSPSCAQRYPSVATARDSLNVPIGQVTDRRASSKRVLELAVRFDAACFRRSEVCKEGSRAEAGSVSAPSRPRMSQAGQSAPDRPGDALDGGSSTGIGRRSSRIPASPVQSRGRSCEGNASLQPLRAPAGLDRRGCVPRERALRPQDRRDAWILSADRTGVPGRSPGTAFCAADETMRECTDLVFATRVPCGPNERCVVTPTGNPACSCRTSFVDDGTGAGCRAAMSCGADNGGCDPLTSCSVGGDGPICGDCPQGYAGTGATGCAPLLESLGCTVQAEPRVHARADPLRVELPLLVQRVGSPRPARPVPRRGERAALTEGTDGRRRRWRSVSDRGVRDASESGERFELSRDVRAQGYPGALKARAPDERDHSAPRSRSPGHAGRRRNYEDGGSPGSTARGRRAQPTAAHLCVRS